ncbi:MAG TPA: DUF4157 domain-containing protein [Roseomonas sp.]|jgi:hypothetical protein
MQHQGVGAFMTRIGFLASREGRTRRSIDIRPLAVPSPILKDIERSFGRDFAGVTFWQAPIPHPVDPPASAIAAVSIADAVFVSPGAAAAPEPQLRRVLAHELAHILQRHNSRSDDATIGTPRELEDEAHIAAHAVAMGLPFRSGLADAEPAMPRFWGEPGHYYTSYLVMLAAGVDNDTARKMAFCCQMPDEVSELDATEAGIGLAGALVQGKLKRNDSKWDIQMGLHALTGRDSALETRLRTEILEGCTFGTLDFGLAIHPYGDSFAHRQIDDPGHMYLPLAGHAIEVANFRNPHAPDNLDQRPALYKAYGLGLYDIVCKQMAARNAKPALARGSLAEMLVQIAKKKEAGEQISLIRAFGLAMSKFMGSYTPETEDLRSWADFLKWHGKVTPAFLTDESFRRARQLAWAWSP